MVIDSFFLIGISFLVPVLQELELQHVSVLSVTAASCVNS